MKKFLIIQLFLLSLTPNLVFASERYNKEYTFKFNLAGESLEIKRTALSYEEAFEQAAQQCFNHYKGAGSVSENRGLDIIDVCANPRT